MARAPVGATASGQGHLQGQPPTTRTATCLGGYSRSDRQQGQGPAEQRLRAEASPVGVIAPGEAQLECGGDSGTHDVVAGDNDTW
ncbi:hypothetical protein BHE74_00028928 [Ensete ventricosum]|nr:hypothetical protein BHE74_00028928 [Ensete ventricosum]